jgi:hypothetical protein
VGVSVYKPIGVYIGCLYVGPQGPSHKHHIHVVQADRRVEEAAVRERSRAEAAAEAKWSMALARARQEVRCFASTCAH